MAISITLYPCTGTDEQGNEITEEKTYYAPSPKARAVRLSAEITNSINQNNMSPEDVDKIGNYIVMIFRKQFTLDELYDELYSKDLVPTFQRCINGLMGEVNDRIGKLPNGHTGK